MAKIKSSEKVIQDLRKSLAWLDLALATLNEGVIVLDGKMKVLFVNDALANMVGKPRILLLGFPVWDIVHLRREDKNISKADYIDAQQNDKVEKLSGVYQLWIESRATIVEVSAAHIANSLHTVIVFRDVTERLQAQAQRVRIAQEQVAREAAQSSEKRILLQYKVASKLAESLAQEATIKEILKIVCESLGWRAGIFWVLDKKSSKLQLASSWTANNVHLRRFIRESQNLNFSKNEGLPGRVWKNLEPQWSNDVSKDDNFLRMSSADKSGLHAAFAIPLMGAKEFVGVMEFFSDHVQRPDNELLTGMSTVGMQIAEYMRRMSMEQVATSLQEQKTYLLELNRAKDEFISIASHQLRTPATGVKQFLGMLIEGYMGELTKAQKEFVLSAYDTNERQITIVNDLLKVARVDAGKVVIKKKKADLDNILINILDEHKAKFDERNQKLSYINTLGIFEVPIDITHFRMAIENIIDNASKYTEPGGGITVTLSKKTEWAVISVEDQGVGIAKNDLEKIFNKFTRIDNPLSVLVGGTGLGLYWCKKIIELHDGKITATSKIGKGTTFNVYIPLK